MATTRPYVIRRRDGTGSPRLVESTHPSRALQHVADAEFSVEVASASDVIRLMQTGVKAEAPKAEAQQELQA